MLGYTYYPEMPANDYCISVGNTKLVVTCATFVAATIRLRTATNLSKGSSSHVRALEYVLARSSSCASWFCISPRIFHAIDSWIMFWLTPSPARLSMFCRMSTIVRAASSDEMSFSCEKIGALNRVLSVEKKACSMTSWNSWFSENNVKKYLRQKWIGCSSKFAEIDDSSLLSTTPNQRNKNEI